jgi:hypothetical protein
MIRSLLEGSKVHLIRACDSKYPSAIAWLVSDGAAQDCRGTLTGRRKESPVAGRQSTAGLAG